MNRPAKDYSAPPSPYGIRRVPLGTERLVTLRKLLYGAVPKRNLDRVVIQGEGPAKIPETYLLIEAARRPDIAVVLEGFGVSWTPLYQGVAADELARHAPYLAHIPADSRALDWMLSEGWGKGWGVWLRSTASLQTLRANFRKFTQIYNPDDRLWYVFRFYAPETMRRIIPALRPSDFTAITRDVEAFIVPDESGAQAVVI